VTCWVPKDGANIEGLKKAEEDVFVEVIIGPEGYTYTPAWASPPCHIGGIAGTNTRNGRWLTVNDDFIQLANRLTEDHFDFVTVPRAAIAAHLASVPGKTQLPAPSVVSVPSKPTDAVTLIATVQQCADTFPKLELMKLARLNNIPTDGTKMEICARLIAAKVPLTAPSK
jgi:hypothetical protein